MDMRNSLADFIKVYRSAYLVRALLNDRKGDAVSRSTVTLIDTFLDNAQGLTSDQSIIRLIIDVKLCRHHRRDFDADITEAISLLTESLSNRRFIIMRHKRAIAETDPVDALASSFVSDVATASMHIRYGDPSNKLFLSTYVQLFSRFAEQMFFYIDANMWHILAEHKEAKRIEDLILLVTKHLTDLTDLVAQTYPEMLQIVPAINRLMDDSRGNTKYLVNTLRHRVQTLKPMSADMVLDFLSGEYSRGMAPAITTDSKVDADDLIAFKTMLTGLTPKAE